MELSQIALLVGVCIIFFIGIIGVLIPVIPSLPVVWSGILLYGAFTGFPVEMRELLLITGILTIIGTVLDAIMTAIGAKIYGSRWQGMLGAMLGGIIGFFTLNIIGLITGSFIGTYAVEYMLSQDKQQALRAAWGTMVGFLCGTVMKFILAVVMIVMFVRYVF